MDHCVSHLLTADVVILQINKAFDLLHAGELGKTPQYQVQTCMRSRVEGTQVVSMLKTCVMDAMQGRRCGWC
jgi:hypothetical protein